jgi:hypothetical protein
VVSYFCVAICSDHIATTEAKIQDNVQYLLLSRNVRNEVAEQLILLSSQLTVYKIEFTDLGFFCVNLKELSTFVFSVVTHIIVFELTKN